MIQPRDQLSNDGLALVMLCSHLGLRNGEDTAVHPFTLKEWNGLAAKIAASELTRPGELLGLDEQSITRLLELTPTEAERLILLLGRGGNIAVELERLAAMGIWCVTRAEKNYPERLKKVLKHQAPPVLFGSGSSALLMKSTMAIVGSRDLDDQAIEFAKRLGTICAQNSIAVVSGGARGTDRISMQAALDAGGHSVGVLADSLSRVIRQPDVRQYLMEDRLLLLTPHQPDSGFSIGAAMGRNKLVYGISDYSVVVSSEYQKGGTWAGAIEALSAAWSPLFVRSSDPMPTGNRELIMKGAQPLPEAILPEIDDIESWMRSRVRSTPQQRELLPV